MSDELGQDRISLLLADKAKITQALNKGVVQKCLVKSCRKPCPM